MAKSKRNNDGLVREAFNSEKVLKEGIKLANHINGINIDGLNVSSHEAKIDGEHCDVPMKYNGIDVKFKYKYNTSLGQKSINFSGSKSEPYCKNFSNYSDLAHLKTELCNNFLNQYKTD